MALESLGLTLNPCASVAIERSVEPPMFLVSAPVRGGQFSEQWVRQASAPDAHRFLMDALVRGTVPADLAAQAVEDLRRIGLFVPLDQVPQAVRYDLSPERHATSGGGLDVTNAVARSGSPVRERGFRIPSDWADMSLRFHPHRAQSVWAPVCASNDELIGVPLAGNESLDDDETTAFFAREGFAVLPELLPASHVAELGRYYWARANEGFMQMDTDRGCRRFVAHSDPIADFWHDQLNRRVTQLVGRPTKPSYSFVSMYLDGGDLKWHVDRPPCEYTITLLIDYAPLDEQGRSPWALQVRGRDGTTHALHQRIGDALIFRGRELTHARDLLPTGHRSGSLLFHFVNAEYDGVMR